MSKHRSYLVICAFLLLGTALVAVLWKREVLSSSREEPYAANSKHTSTGSESRKRTDRANPIEADQRLSAEGARTDMSLSAFPIKEYKSLPAPSGKAAGAPVGDAYIHVPSAGRRIAMEPNQIGEFPAVETRLNDTVGIRLAIDSVKPGTPVRVVILDGGSFPDSQSATRIIPARDWRGVDFEFTTSGNIGYHRVLVQAQGQPSRIVTFNAHDADTWPAPSTASN